MNNTAIAINNVLIGTVPRESMTTVYQTFSYVTSANTPMSVRRGRNVKKSTLTYHSYKMTQITAPRPNTIQAPPTLTFSMIRNTKEAE